MPWMISENQLNDFQRRLLDIEERYTQERKEQDRQNNGHISIPTTSMAKPASRVIRKASLTPIFRMKK